MIELTKQMLVSQFQASLCMFHEGIRRCSAEHWDGRIATHTFRQIAYHTLFFVDLYLSPSEEEFTWRELHKRGGDELQDEPTAGLTREETLEYTAICRQKAIDTIASENADVLQGGSGFPYRKFSRLELHVYNIRHIQHHTGQLSAFLRRTADVAVPWVGMNWKEFSAAPSGS